jgi:aspartate/methionine/tyrosine aminotransferase
LSQLGGGERAAQTFWKEYGVKVLPGAYLAQTGSGGDNPGSPYARLALVDSPDVTAEALSRIARFLS